jgi:hypothetical protein
VWLRRVSSAPRRAAGTWLLFTDADVRFERGYFERLPACLDGDAFYGPKRSTGAHAFLGARGRADRGR